MKKKTAKKPSKTLTAKVAAYNKLNEKNNKMLAAKRKAIAKQARKEGFTVSLR